MLSTPPESPSRVRHVVFGLALTLCVGAGLVGTAGCGDSTGPSDGQQQSSNSDDDSETELTVSNQEFCNKMGDAWCEKTGYCRRPDPYPVEQCKSMFSDTCIGDDDPAEKVAAEQKLQSCLDAINDLSCESVDNGVTPDACTFDDEGS